MISNFDDLFHKLIISSLGRARRSLITSARTWLRAILLELPPHLIVLKFSSRGGMRRSKTFLLVMLAAMVVLGILGTQDIIHRLNIPKSEVF